MPGYIIHLTAAQMVLEKYKQKYTRKWDENAFLFGNLLPDTTSNKAVSHFRSPERYGKRIEYPELRPFIEKYVHLFNADDDSCFGYCYHLYVDRLFFKDYLPTVVTFLGEDGKENDTIEGVKWAYVKKSGKTVPIESFLSEDYYYGDFTKMNNYLIERYNIPLELDLNVKNQGIEEVDYSDIEVVLKKLRGYLNMSYDELPELNVFDLEDLLEFLEEIGRKWLGLKEENR